MSIGGVLGVCHGTTKKKELRLAGGMGAKGEISKWGRNTMKKRGCCSHDRKGGGTSINRLTGRAIIYCLITKKLSKGKEKKTTAFGVKREKKGTNP